MQNFSPHLRKTPFQFHNYHSAKFERLLLRFVSRHGSRIPDLGSAVHPKSIWKRIPDPGSGHAKSVWKRIPDPGSVHAKSVENGSRIPDLATPKVPENGSRIPDLATPKVSGNGSRIPDLATPKVSRNGSRISDLATKTSFSLYNSEIPRAARSRALHPKTRKVSFV